MTKNNFLKALERGIKGIEKIERKRLLDYYGELFDDKLEAGETEEEIIAGFGGVSGLCATILADYPDAANCRHPAWRILARTGLVLLTPVVFVMGIALFALVLSLFVTSGVLVLAGLFYIPFSVPVFAVSTGVGVVQIGICLLGVGIGIFLFFGSVRFNRLSIFMMKKTFGFYGSVFGKEAL